MSARREVMQRWRSLGEVREVMGSMKTLAYMETRKIARFLEVQHEQVAQIEAMAADLLEHFPRVRPHEASRARGVVMVGAERGFCGDFNERLVSRVQETNGLSALIAVGQRLVTRLSPGRAALTAVDGASASEQVASVRDALAAAVVAAQREHGPLSLQIVYHDSAGPGTRSLFPPFGELQRPARRPGHAPALNLAPGALYAALLDQYLFAVLSEVLYTSLMAENQKRVQHLDAATRHVDERREELARRGRVLAQEEVIEEIEVLLLNVHPPGTAAHRP